MNWHIFVYNCIHLHRFFVQHIVPVWQQPLLAVVVLMVKRSKFVLCRFKWPWLSANWIFHCCSQFIGVAILAVPTVILNIQCLLDYNSNVSPCPWNEVLPDSAGLWWWNSWNYCGCALVFAFDAEACDCPHDAALCVQSHAQCGLYLIGNSNR